MEHTPQPLPPWGGDPLSQIISRAASNERGCALYWPDVYEVQQCANGLLKRIVDVLLLPMTPEPPLTLEDAMAGSVERVMERMARFARFARLFNGLGVPALALPMLAAPGPPLAVQLVARPFGEPVLLRLGAALEAAGGAPPAVCPERLA